MLRTFIVSLPLAFSLVVATHVPENPAHAMLTAYAPSPTTVLDHSRDYTSVAAATLQEIIYPKYNVTKTRLVNDNSVAASITITEIRTETLCRPEIMCNVRRESTQTGTLIAPAIYTPPPPSPSSASQASGEGAMTPMAANSAGKPRIMGDTLRGQATQGAAGVVGIMGAQAKNTPKTEHSASALLVPTLSGKKPVDADAAATMQAVSSAKPEPTPTLARPPMITPSGNGIDSLSIGNSAFPIVPLVSMGPHTEAAGAVLAIGTHAAALGETVTINDHPVVITQSAGSTMAIIQDTAGGSEAANTIVLNMPDASAAVGGVFAPSPKAAVKPAAAPVTVGNAILTPDIDGGYSVAGKSLSLGGTVTLDSGDADASPTVLSLTTDAAGHGVLAVNGESTTLPDGPEPTDSAGAEPADAEPSVKPGVFDGAAAPSARTWRLPLLVFAWTALVLVR